MVKKLNKDAVAIKELLNKGYKQSQIVKILKIKKGKVCYWANNKIIEKQKRKKKLKQIYLDAIRKWANNKETIKMSSRIITYKLNNLLRKRNELDCNKKTMSIHFTTINKYLREYFCKPLKIRKVFYISNEQMKKRKKFCEMVLNKKYKPQQILFSDETKIELGPYTNDETIRSYKKRMG